MNKWMLRPLAVAVSTCFVSSPVLANPTGAQVIRGTVSMATPDAKTLNVTNSPGSIINWQGFSIGAGEITRFIQQSSSSAVLNRVVGADISQIAGQLLSNGRVFLINPAGIVIGGGAVIDTAGFVASTLSMKDADFLSGKLKFDGDSTAGSIVNQGWIKASSGGNVILVAPSVTNSGIVQTDGGQIILAAGQKLTIGSLEYEGVQFEVQAPTDSALNVGKLLADGGAVGVFAGTLKHSGDIRANALTRDEAGRIVLRARGDVTVASGSTTAADGKTGGNITIQSETGTTLVSGGISAKGSAGKGGDIRVLGERVGIIDSAVVNASGELGGGQILIGGDYRGQNGLVQNALRTHFGLGASLRADATTAGDGGRIIVWSNDATRAYGTISARGGARSGNGGFVETSGHYLDVFSSPDVSARNGRGGTWLLDPFNITITATTTSPDNTGQPNFTPGADESQVSALQIVGRLDGGNSVTIDTAGGGGGGADGNITVAASIATTGGAGATLTLNADGVVNVNAPISVPEHNVTIVAGRGAAGSGAVRLNNQISTASGTNGGNIAITARGNIIFDQGAPPALNAQGDTLAQSGTISLTSTAGSIQNDRTTFVAVANSRLLTINSHLGITSTTDLSAIPQFATSVGTVAVTATNGNFAINNQQALTVNASTAPAGSLYFATGAPAGAVLTIAGAVSAGTLVSLQSDDLAIGNTITAPSVTIGPITNGRNVALGANTAGTLGLTDAELDFVNATTLRIGTGPLIGNVSVDGAITPANITNLSINTNSGTVTQTASITVPSLEIGATAVTLNDAANAISTLAGRASGGGAFSFVNSRALTSGTVADFTGINNGAATGTTNLTTNAGNIVLNAAVGNTSAATTLTSAGNVTGNSTVSGTDVLIQSDTGIGVSAVNRVSTAANNLTARSVTSGSVFVSEADAVTLVTAAGFGPIPNGAAGVGTYDLTAAGTVTVNGAVNAGAGNTGNTLLATTGANTRNIVLNADVGNATGATTLTSAGNISRTAGTVTGTNVTLDSATGVGGSTAARINTAATTLMARTTASGGVFVSEANGVTLNSLGGLDNGVQIGNSAYDVTAAGTITVAGAVNTTGTGTGTTTFASTAGGDIALGADVGKSTAATVLTSAGAITRTGGTVIGTNVSLDSAGGVGVLGTPVSTTAATLMARTTGTGGVFVSETDGVTLNSIGGLDNGTVGGGAYNVTAAGTLDVAGAVTAAGIGAVTLATTGANNIALAAGGIVTGGSITANAPGGTITDGGTAGRFDTSANNGAITLSAASIGGAATHAGVNVNPGVGAGTVNATATTGSIYLERAAAAATSQYTFNVQTAGQTAGLEADGNIDVNADLNLAGRNIVLTTNGVGGINNITFGNPLTVTAAGLTLNTTAGADAHFASAVTLNTPLTVGANARTLVDGAANLVANGATTLNGGLTWNGGTIGGTGAISVPGTTTVAGGAPQITGTFSTGVLNETAGALTITNTGTLNITGPGPSTITAGTLTNNGTFNLQAGTFNANAGFQPNNGTLQLGAGTTFTATTNITNNRGGTITGTGTFNVGGRNALINNGTLAPGASPGTMVIMGNYVQGPGGTLLMELGGVTQGVTYDLLQVTGTANLDGTLQATNVNGFSPSSGNVFDVMTFGNRNGDFSTFNLPTGLVPIAGASEYRLALAGSAPGLDGGFIAAEEGRRQLPSEEILQPPLGLDLCR